MQHKEVAEDATGSWIKASSHQAQPSGTPSRTLAAYISRSGNTRVVAGLIHREPGVDLFEIRPALPYPEGYLVNVEQARQERDSGFEPALETKVSNMAGYGTVYLGFPIWGDTTPRVIRRFIKAQDTSGKVLIPIVIHGGHGLGDSQLVLVNYTPKAQLRRGFSLDADQERGTMNRVKAQRGRFQRLSIFDAKRPR